MTQTCFWGSVRFTFKCCSSRGQSSWRSLSEFNTVQQVGSSTDSRLRSIPVCAAGPDVNSFNRTHSGFQPSAPLTSESHNTRHDRKHMRSGQGSWRRERERDRSIELLKPHQQRASCFIDFPETASAVQQGQQKRQEKSKGKCPVPKICETLKNILSQQELITEALAERPHISLHLHLFVLFMMKS